MRTHASLTRLSGAALFLVSLALVAGCGGDDNTESRPSKIADCLENEGARAATAESVREGALGTVDMLEPGGTIQVFESESAAKKFVAQAEQHKPTQIGSITVQTNDPRALELARKCASA